MIKRLVCILVAIATVLIGSAAFAQITPGNVAAIKQESDGVLLTMQHGVYRIEVCTPSIIHVLYSPNGSFPHHTDPMVVRTSWPASPFKLSQSDKSVSIATPELSMSIARRRGGISFTDSQGHELLHSGGGSGIVMRPATVNGEQTYHAEVDFSPAADEAFYGLGQHQAGAWNYAGEDVQLSQDNTNISIPFFVSSRGYGFFWNNASLSRFNDRFARHLFIDGNVADTVDYYFIYGPGMDQVISGYRDLTGQAPLFGKWAYGYWQCKNRYESQDEVLRVAREYRELGIPADNIVQDWFWWTQRGSFIFNKNYPDPKAMVSDLHRDHFHIMISVWPTFQPGTIPFETMKRNGWFIPMNRPKGRGLPGSGPYDAFSAKARAYYWKLIDDNLFRIGFDAWWLDATEPESSGEQNLMETAHTAIGNGARYTNIYPLMTTTGVYEGQRAATSQKRVFILTRSAAPGMQRNAATAWSGDIFCTWTVLRRQVKAGLNYMLSGLPYWTTDIGGFVWGDPKDPAYRELFVRWFEYGAFCPIFRVHGTRASGDNALWSYGKEAQSILTQYDVLRYRLMPYIYSVAWRVTHDGYTMMRPLVMDFPNDAQALQIGNQFMFGPSILVNPVTHPGAETRRLYLPAGTWYNFWTGEALAGGKWITAPAPLGTMPLYVHAGSIVPMGPVIQYTGEKPDAPIELRVYPGADGNFTLYNDDGTTYDYEKGQYTTIPIHWDDSTQTLTIGARQGSYPGMARRRTFNIVWVSPGHGAGVPPVQFSDRTVEYGGTASISIQRQVQ
jgi:alpha-D-xyloside xylohydrolase